MADFLFDLQFRRKYKGFQDMCKSLSFRAAYQIETKQWNATKTLPREPAGYALVDYENSDERWIHFEYCGQEYSIRLWTFRPDERNRIVGHCSVFKLSTD